MFALEPLTVEALKSSAASFVQRMNGIEIPKLYGTTDGKAVGTYVEHDFHDWLLERSTYVSGNSASGIDFPELQVDLKVTSIKQPQSSCPFSSASQKIYGLGYHLLVFVYEKQDDAKKRTAHLEFLHAVFVNKSATADFQTTQGLRGILDRDGNLDDVVAFLEERNLPLDEIGRQTLAEQILREPPAVGYLTVSNALQWRLQYGRVLALASAAETPGVENLLRVGD
jgi:hypothetical protein